MPFLRLYLRIFAVVIVCGNAAMAHMEVPQECERLLLSLSPGLEFKLAKESVVFREASGAKEWTVDERRQVEQSLASFFQHSNLSYFFEKIAVNGFAAIYRFSHPVEFSFVTGAYEGLKDSKVAAIANNEHRIIEVYDRYFKQTYIDPALAYGSPQYILMHELVHAFDMNELSLSSEFLRLTGWEQVKTGESFLGPTFEWRLKSVDMDELKIVKQTVQDLWDQGRYERSLEVERQFVHKHGMPSLYAMLNPKECLAEIGAHIVFDRSPDRYLAPEVMTWARSNVLR